MPDNPEKTQQPTRRKPKNIVLCCDGTSNEFDGVHTNVVKLYRMLRHDESQVAYYHPGLGTMEAAGALTFVARSLTRLLGHAFGYGLRNDIRDAYVFLMNRYEADDKVFIFGFSRGAYTARAVAALLHMYGLIRPGGEALVPYAIRMMMRIDEREAGRTFELAGQFKQTFASLDCKPYFVGIWDTVNSVGWVGNPLRLPYTGHNPSIEVGRHAIAIDERRAFFREYLWHPKARKAKGPKDLLQVWFPGSHGDVGGGYPETDSHLSKVALEWMLREAQHKGLKTLSEREARIMGEAGGGYVEPDAKNGNLHDELVRRPVWWLAQLFPKRQWQRRTENGEEIWVQRRKMSLSGWRKLPPGSRIHDAAYARDPAYVAKLPADATRVSTLPPL